MTPSIHELIERARLRALLRFKVNAMYTLATLYEDIADVFHLVSGLYSRDAHALDDDSVNADAPPVVEAPPPVGRPCRGPHAYVIMPGV